MGTRRSRRADLFLVRVWAAGTGAASTAAEWHGKVQRVTDGESHEFHDWQGLVEWLLAMLAEKEGR